MRMRDLVLTNAFHVPVCRVMGAVHVFATPGIHNRNNEKDPLNPYRLFMRREFGC